MNKRFAHSIVALILTAGPLPAALEFTLAPAIKSGAVGTEVTFSGTLKNNSPTANLFLNDIQFSLNAAATAALSPDSNVFFANVPGILLPNETYTGPIFTILINGSANQTDYSGSVTIRGGADIFALTDLLTQSFQVSSPSITISATTSEAYEFGPVAGVFTVSRSGSNNYAVTINYAVSGSATPGTRYSPLSGSVTVPAGASSAPITVTPLPNETANGIQTVTITVSALAAYNVGSPAADTVAIHDKPIDVWRLEHFGANANAPAIAGDNADPDKDAVSNLLEYALFADPNVSSVVDLPAVTISGNHLQLQFHRNTSATDLTYIVEGRSDLNANNWLPVVSRNPGNDWIVNQAGASAIESGSGDYVSVTVTDSVPVIDSTTSQPTPHRFLRLRVQR